MTESNTALLDRARAGDREALEALLLEHQAQIYRFSMKMCRDEQDAQDVVQDTLIALARGVREFRGESSLSTWLFTVARSYCLKKHRTGKYAPKAIVSLDTDEGREADRLESQAKTPEEALTSKRVEHAIEHAIASLEPNYREVLLLRDVEGLTAPEVAQIVGVSVQAVKSRLHRARLLVRESLAPELGIPLEVVAPTGVPCPDVLLLFSQHLEGEISAEVCAQMEEHIRGCKRCSNTCESLKRTLSLCRTSTTPTTKKVSPAIQESIRMAIQNFLLEPT